MDAVFTETRDTRTGWIHTFTGRHVFPLAMTPDMVDTADIAHHLAIKSRFTGAVREPYSIGEHSCRVSDLLAAWGMTPVVQLAGLLHDVGEYVLPDVAAPIKEAVFLRLDAGGYIPFTMVERFIRFAVYDALDLPDMERLVESAAVHEADRRLCATEARDLMHGTSAWPNAAEPLRDPIEPWSWQQAEMEFVTRLTSLLAKVKNVH